MNRVRVAGVLALLAAAVFLSAPARARTALEHLEAAPKPVFRRGHTLPPLTRWGWAMPFEVRVALTEKWGYALEFGEANEQRVAKLEDPTSIESRLVALTAADPVRYPLFVLTYRPLLKPEVRAQLPEATWCSGEGGAKLDAPQWKLWSPEAPDEVFKMAAEGALAPLLKIQEKAPIAVILNGGEYGLSVFGHSGKFWQQDPKVVAAKGEREWFDYISERKAHQEGIITEAVRAAFPKRTLYIWYHFAGQPTWDAWQWSLDYRYMRKVTDLPDQSLYYKHFNTGWTGGRDLLTNFLQATAQAIALGDPLSYNWVCAGWGDREHSDPERYMGFLKCLYASGMTGAVAGYFALPKGGFGADLGEETPSWLWQMTHLAHTHALFSHLEDFIREGDLLPGPDKHRRLASVPAYEFPTGHRDTRVLARRHRKRAEWLIVAWAADGQERKVSVHVPDLGDVEVLARPCGTVYRAAAVQQTDYEPPVPKLTLVDPDGMHPSAGFARGK